MPAYFRHSAGNSLTSVEIIWFGMMSSINVEPESGNPGQDISLVRQSLRYDDVKRRNTIGSDDEKRIAEIIDIAYLAATGLFKVREVSV